MSIIWWGLLTWFAAQPRPNPGLAPSEVIRTVVEAMQNRDKPSPNAGIFTVYQFASPANRARTGPYGSFVQLVKLPPYDALFAGRAEHYGSLAVAGDRAEQAVGFRIQGGAVWFRFIVSRQTGGRCAGCWMVDGVVPMPHEP